MLNNNINQNKNLPQNKDNSIFENNTGNNSPILGDNNYSSGGNNLIILYVIIGIIIVALLGFLGYWYYKNYVHTNKVDKKTITQEKPSLQKIIDNYKNDVHSINAEMVMNFNIKSIGTAPNTGSNTGLGFHFVNHKGTINIEDKFDLINNNYKLKFLFNLNEMLPFSIELLRIDDKKFIKSNDLEGIISQIIDEIPLSIGGKPLTAFMDLPSLNDKWIKILSNEIEYLSSFFQEFIKSEQFDQYKKNINIKNVLNILTIIQKNNTFNFKYLDKIKEDDGKFFYRYSFNLTKEKLLDFLEELYKNIDDPSILAQYKQFLDVFKKEFKSLPNEIFKGEIFVGEKDLLVHKIFLTGQSVDPKNKLATNVKIQLKLEYNEPVKLSEPTDAKSLKKVLQVLQDFESLIRPLTPINNLPESNNNFSISNNNENLDSDNDGLPDNQEINIYHTNPYNPDSDGDGYLDGAEVKNGYNPNGPGKLPR